MNLYRLDITLFLTFATITPQGDGNLARSLSIASSKLPFATITPQGDGNTIAIRNKDGSIPRSFATITPQGDGNC